jgi:hypothetical protein
VVWELPAWDMVLPSGAYDAGTLNATHGVSQSARIGHHFSVSR